MPDLEVDFPRGGAPIQPKKHTLKIEQPFNVVPKRKKFNDSENEDGDVEEVPKAVQKKTQFKKKNDEEDSTYSNVFRRVMNVEQFTEDLRGLGCVKEVHDTHITLECVEGIQVTLNCNHISRKFNELLEKREISYTLEDIFKIGQLLAFKVTKKAANQGPRHLRKPEVSINPVDVNSHLLPANMKNGLVVNGAVTSIEEKGAVIDLGLKSNIQGFVSKDDLPEYLKLNKLHLGQVILFRVKKDPNEKGRITRLSAYSEVEVFEDDKLNLNHIMPGTILHANPEKVVGDGIFVGLDNEVKVFLWKNHLPPRLRLDISRFAKSIRVAVLCSMPNSNIFVVSAHPDVVNLSKYDRRTLPEAFKIGEKVTATVYAHDKQGNILFSIEESEGHLSLITAKMLRIMLDDYENNVTKYAPGTEHTCRIIGYHAIERMLMVSTKKEVLKQKILSSEQAKPGQRVTGTVTEINPNGVAVDLGQGLRGFIPKMHVHDRESGIWAKNIKIDQKLPCRVWLVNSEKNSILLTAKPSLVNMSDKMVMEYSEDLVGEIVTGVIVKQVEDGGLVVTFFNRVGGFLRQAEVRKMTSFEIGMPIKVRIDRVDPERGRMTLSLGHDDNTHLVPNIKPKQVGTMPKKDTQASVGKPKIVLKKAKPAKIFQIHTAKIIGLWNYGGCSPTTAVELDVNGSVGRLHASELDLTQYKEGTVPIKVFLNKYDKKAVNVKVIQVGNQKLLSAPGRAKMVEEKGTHRFVECTMNPDKIKETKKKQSLINIQDDFTHGSIVPVFMTNFGGRNNAKQIAGEVNPLYHAYIQRERSNKIIPNPSEDSTIIKSMIDIDFEDGELVMGRVIGVNKGSKKKYLQMSLVQGEAPEHETKIIGRVDAIQEAPLKITFGLANGQKGVLTPTGIVGDYKGVDVLKSYFSHNKLFELIVWSYDELNSEWVLVTQERLKTPSKKSHNSEINPLINDAVDLKPKQTLLKGYVRSTGDVGEFVEISPNLIGKFKSDMKFNVNDLLLVEISSVTDGKIKLAYKNHIIHAPKVSVVGSKRKRQRTLSLDSTGSLSTAEKKSKAAGYSIPIVKIASEDAAESGEPPKKPELPDPGFDWTGFSMEEMAAVGQERNDEGQNEEESDKKAKKKVKKETGVEKDAEMANFERVKNLMLAEKDDEIEIDEPEGPQNEVEFDKIVSGNPDDSTLWIKYMTFFLQKGETDKARFIAERALDGINFREEIERQNIWTAYLNLEVLRGTPESVKAVFNRATANSDSLKIHKQLARIYANRKMHEELDDLYQSMLKKFRHEDIEVWFMYGQFMLENDQAQKCRDLLQRALQSLPKPQHLTVLSRFATIEYKFGDTQRGKTMFEKILETYPKKPHIWSLYVDMILKYENLDEARRVLERATTIITGHKLKSVFKKWLEVEEKYGDEDHFKMVQKRAIQYIDTMKDVESDQE